jgi:hypothetical protein
MSPLIVANNVRTYRFDLSPRQLWARAIAEIHVRQNQLLDVVWALPPSYSTENFPKPESEFLMLKFPAGDRAIHI